MDLLWTAPPVAASQQATHVTGEENGVWLVPLDIAAPMFLRRVSVAVSTVGGTARSFAMAVYRLDATGFVASKSDPATTMRKASARLIATLGQTTSTALPTAPGMKHFEAAGKDIEIDPSRGHHFLGYQAGHADCRWAAPSAVTIEETDIGVGSSLTTFLGVADQERYLLSFRAPYAGAPVAIRHYIGNHSTSHTATLAIRLRSSGAALTTYTRVGRPLWQSDTGATVTFAADIYDLTLKCSSANGQALFGGLVIEWGAQASATEAYLRGFKTRPLGAAIGDFPERLSFVSAGVPIVASLRSALGVRRFAVLGTD